MEIPGCKFNIAFNAKNPCKQKTLQNLSSKHKAQCMISFINSTTLSPQKISIKNCFSGLWCCISPAFFHSFFPHAVSNKKLGKLSTPSSRRCFISHTVMMTSWPSASLFFWVSTNPPPSLPSHLVLSCCCLALIFLAWECPPLTIFSASLFTSFTRTPIAVRSVTKFFVQEYMTADGKRISMEGGESTLCHAVWRKISFVLHYWHCMCRTLTWQTNITAVALTSNFFCMASTFSFAPPFSSVPMVASYNKEHHSYKAESVHDEATMLCTRTKLHHV